MLSRRRSIDPESGSIVPAMIFKSVVLPDPLFPMRPILSSSWMLREALFNTT